MLKLSRGKMNGLTLYMVLALILSSTLPIALAMPAAATSGSLADVPPESVRIPPMVKEHSISTYVPSEGVPGSGVAVNLIYPKKARYKDGAPIAVVIPGGLGPSGLGFEMHACQTGIVEVRFAFPGGGTPQFGTAGTFDNRGEESLKALKDVILFAGGQKADYKGRSVEELLKPVVKVQPENIGLVGWDIGGNQALAVLGKYSVALSFVKWLVFYESPVGSMFCPASLGSASDLLLNKHYREGSAATGNILMDYRKLNWAETSFRTPNRLTSRKRGSPGLKGVLYFDENANNIWEESYEFAFTSALDVDLMKQYFPPQITGAIQRVELFKGYWPKNIATLEETEKFFADRDGSLFVEKVASEFPDLFVTIFASKADHDQQQPDHPHIAFLYNSFLGHKVRFLRLNPDPNYMVAVGGMNHINFANNKPNAAIDSDSIMEQLESEGLLPDYVYIEAAVAELADRTKGKIYKETLNGVIVDYTNGATETPKPEAATTKTEETKLPPAKPTTPAKPASGKKAAPKSAKHK